MDKKGVGGVFVLLIVGVIAVAVGGIPSLSHNGAIQENERTTAVVTNTGVDMKIVEDDDGNQDKKFRPVVEYEYTVDGETYQHDNVMPGSFTRWQDSRTWASSIAGEFQEGEDIEVYYNPRDHSHAYVREGELPGSWFIGAGYALLAIAAGIWLIRVGFNRRKQRSLMEDTPTEQAESLSMGPSEVKGTALTLARDPAPAPFTDEDCVVAKWEVEEYREDSDDDGGSWHTVDSGLRLMPFYVDDGTGEIPVRPHQDATYDLEEEDWNTVSVDSASQGPSAVQSFVEGSASVGYPSGGAGKDGDRRYKQNLIKPDESIYVFGTVQPRSDGHGGTSNVDNLVIEKVDEDDPRMEPMFMISDDAETDLVTKRRWALWRIPVGIVFAVFGVGLLLGILGPSVGIQLPVPPQLL
jgi:hypothetical protein